MTRLRFAGVLLGPLLLPGLARAGSDEDFPRKAKALVKSHVDAGLVVSASAAVYRRGKPVLTTAAGMASLELRVPATEKTVYRVGSVTKEVTAAALFRLVEQGKLEVSDPIGQFVPELWPVHASLRQLLEHTSGIREMWGLLRVGLGRSELLKLLAKEPVFEPGEGFSYSNSNYYLLGLAVQEASGRTFQAFAKDEVLAKVKLRSTSFCSGAEVVPDLAQGYTFHRGHVERAVDLAPDGEHAGLNAAVGGLCSTPADLATFQEALLAGRVVSPDSVAMMTTRAVTKDGKARDHGAGLFVGTLEGHARVGHGGHVEGFSAAVDTYPDDGLTVAVTGTGGSVTLISDGLARLALGLPLPQVKDVKTTAAERAKYVGTYKLSRQKALVLEQDGTLEVCDEGIPTEFAVPLVYQGGDDFLVRGSTTHVTFKMSNGRAVAMSRGDDEGPLEP